MQTLMLERKKELVEVKRNLLLSKKAYANMKAGFPKKKKKK